MTYEPLQNQVEKYDEKHDWHDKTSQIILHMTEEIGEISRWMLHESGYKKPRLTKKELEMEITDLLYLTLKLANNEDIKLDPAWSEMWDRYEQRYSRK